jgi:hypothetical protein
MQHCERNNSRCEEYKFRLLIHAQIHHPTYIADKYRVQSDAYENCCVFVDELIRRLANHHGDNEYRLSFVGQLPTQEYFAMMEHHLEVGEKDG